MRIRGYISVYLPTLSGERACTKVPLVVAVEMGSKGVGHITAVGSIEGELNLLPLTDSGGEDLPIR